MDIVVFTIITVSNIGYRWENSHVICILTNTRRIFLTIQAHLLNFPGKVPRTPSKSAHGINWSRGLGYGEWGYSVFL